MESIEDRTPASSSPIILAGCFCLIAGIVAVIWSFSGFLLLGGAVLFEAIAGVLGYQRQSAVLIMTPLMVGVVIMLYAENQASTAMKEISDEMGKIDKAMRGLTVPRVKKFD